MLGAGKSKLVIVIGHFDYKDHCFGLDQPQQLHASLHTL